jgi:hypothetical protein
MAFNGFYFDWKWWSGSYSVSRQFNFGSPVNVLAFGALTAMAVTGGAGSAYIGIIEQTAIDPNTGRPINIATPIPGQTLPSPSLANKNVLGLTFALGGNMPPVNHVQYANANMNILLWS